MALHMVFPSMATAILVGRQPSVNAVERAIETDKILFVVTQKNPAINEPRAEDLYSVGTIVKIGFFFRMPDGTIKLMLEGLSRAKVIEYLEIDNYMAARIEEIETIIKGTKEEEALARRVESLFEQYVNMNPRVPGDVLLAVQSVEDRSSLADTVAAHLLVRNELKQKVLEVEELEERFVLLIRILNEEIELLNVERELDEKVSNQVSRSQKELYLHEKMKAIKKELGQSDELDEYFELKRKIKKARMSREPHKAALRELVRLKMMAPMAPEANVVRTYIETLVSLPWRRRTKDNLLF